MITKIKPLATQNLGELTEEKLRQCPPPPSALIQEPMAQSNGSKPCTQQEARVLNQQSSTMTALERVERLETVLGSGTSGGLCNRLVALEIEILEAAREGDVCLVSSSR